MREEFRIQESEVSRMLCSASVGITTESTEHCRDEECRDETGEWVTRPYLKVQRLGLEVGR